VTTFVCICNKPGFLEAALVRNTSRVVEDALLVVGAQVLRASESEAAAAEVVADYQEPTQWQDGGRGKKGRGCIIYSFTSRYLHVFIHFLAQGGAITFLLRESTFGC
jgi:hypothetical protein